MDIQTDWRFNSERFQQRKFVLSAFIEMGYEIDRDVYEFCDTCLSQGYSLPDKDYLLDLRYRFYEYKQAKNALQRHDKDGETCAETSEEEPSTLH